MIPFKRLLEDLVIKLRFRSSTKKLLGNNDNLVSNFISTYSLKNPLLLKLFKFLLLYFFCFFLVYLFLIRLSFIKVKRKKKAGKNLVINEIETYLFTYNIKLAIILVKGYQLPLNNSLLKKFFIKISLFKEVFDLFHLRIYINKALNKILIDRNLRKLIKSEILLVPRGTFKEFINLYNDLKNELESLSLEKK